MIRLLLIVGLIACAPSLYAWHCPNCGKSFASDGAVEHHCDMDACSCSVSDASSGEPTAFDWIYDSGFSYSPSTEENAGSVIAEFLGYLPRMDVEDWLGFYDNPDHPELAPGVFQWLYSWFDHLNFTSHGSSLVGSHSIMDKEAIQKLRSYCEEIHDEQFDKFATLATKPAIIDVLQVVMCNKY